MVDGEVAKLKAELKALNLQCQLARDNEIRYALQRGRLEAERATLLARMVEAQAAPEIAPAPRPEYTIRYAVPTSPETVSLDAAGLNGAPAVVASFVDVVSAAAAKAVEQVQQPKGKPDGIPSTPAMVRAALENAGDGGLRPRDVIAFIREKYWPNVRSVDVSSAMWRMAQAGKLTSKGGVYHLNGTPALVD